MCLVFFSDFNQTGNTRISADLNETPAIKFHEDPFSRTRVVPCGRTESRTDGQSLQTALISAFCKFENAPKRFRDAKNKNQGMDTNFQ